MGGQSPFAVALQDSQQLQSPRLCKLPLALRQLVEQCPCRLPRKIARRRKWYTRAVLELRRGHNSIWRWQYHASTYLRSASPRALWLAWVQVKTFQTSAVQPQPKGCEARYQIRPSYIYEV